MAARGPAIYPRVMRVHGLETNIAAATFKLNFLSLNALDNGIKVTGSPCTVQFACAEKPTIAEIHERIIVEHVKPLAERLAALMDDDELVETLVDTVEITGNTYFEGV